MMSNNGKQNSVTFRHQGSLPRLPIPTLEETLEKFRLAVKALETLDEQEETKTIVESFKAHDGPKLQKLLLDYDHEGKENNSLGSYVESFWDESYLSPDVSVVLNLNPFFALEDGPDPKAKDQIRRAASLCFASIKLASLLKHETLTPDVFRGKALCMDQFKALFGSARVPQKRDKDSIEVYPDSTHIAVLCHNQMYQCQVLWPDGSVAVDEVDIADILRAIHKNSEETCLSAKQALGVLTSLPRGEWAAVREEIAAFSPGNSGALSTIDSALFVLVLDDFIPSNDNEIAANMLHGTYKLSDNQEQIGTCCNRWYDKLQIIVCADGSTGVNFEHSAIDGHTALRFVSDIVAETIVVFAQSITKLIHGIGHLPHVVQAEIRRAALVLDANGAPTMDVFPKKLVFDLPNLVTNKIFYAETALGDEIVASDTVVLHFEEFGKALIVANSMSPDAVVQMSMILAYYRLYGKIICTYEPVLTKAFYHGRTEAQRSATPEAAKFCHTWCCESSAELRLAALQKATNEHSRLVKEAAQGKGVDRHLFALKCIAERNNLPVPTFFKSRPWKTLNKTILSTSNCGNPSLKLFGFGPVVPDGYGIGYIIKDDALSYSVSSKHRQTKRYVKTLHDTLVEFKSLLKPASVVQVDGAVSVNAASKRHSSLLEVQIPEDEGMGSFDDFFGETSFGQDPLSFSPFGKEKTGTNYFSAMKPRKSIDGSLLSKIGLRVKLSSGDNGK